MDWKKKLQGCNCILVISKKMLPRGGALGIIQTGNHAGKTIFFNRDIEPNGLVLIDPFSLREGEKGLRGQSKQFPRFPNKGVEEFLASPAMSVEEAISKDVTRELGDIISCIKKFKEKDAILFLDTAFRRFISEIGELHARIKLDGVERMDLFRGCFPPGSTFWQWGELCPSRDILQKCNNILREEILKKIKEGITFLEDWDPIFKILWDEYEAQLSKYSIRYFPERFFGDYLRTRKKGGSHKEALAAVEGAELVNARELAEGGDWDGPSMFGHETRDEYYARKRR